MSRPIKFRAWEKDEKKMRYFGEMTYCSEYNLLAWELDEASHREDGGSYLNLDTWDIDGFEVMQFTGLLDKNGKEIYEGDIVSWQRSSLETRNFEVRFIDGCFMPFNMEHPVHHFVVEPDKVSVVGNIHENPEPLK